MGERYLVKFDANLGWLFKERPFEERFDLAAAAGFAGVEFPAPYPYAPGLLADRLTAAGLRQVLINTPAGDPGTPTAWGLACLPDRTQEFREGFRLALDYAGQLGTAFIHLLGGTRPADLPQDLAFRTYVENIAWAAEQASSTSVQVLLEAINQQDAPGYVLESVDQGIGVVRDLGLGNVRIMLDIYHAGMNGEDIPGCVDRAMPLVSHVQVADVPGRHEPGSGRLDWPAIFTQLASSGYDGWVGCEFGPTGTTEQALAFRDTFARRPGGDEKGQA